MMSLALIRELSREAAVDAQRKKKQPVFLYPEDIEVLERKSLEFPFLGEYVPKGWERVENLDELDYTTNPNRHGVYSGALFVDASGFGRPGEPAMTYSQFCELAEELSCRGYAFAVVEQGQFQVNVGIYKRK